MTRLHDLDHDELRCLRLAYEHPKGEVAAMTRHRGHNLPRLAFAICESLARRSLLKFHHVHHDAGADTKAYVYRITREGRAELYPETPQVTHDA